MPCTLLENETQHFLQWVDVVRTRTADPYERAEQLVSRLGANYRNGNAEFGFYAPELVDKQIPDDNWFLEVLTPLDPLDLQAQTSQVRFQREKVPLVQDGEFVWGVVSGVKPGTRAEVGSFYWLRYQDRQGRWHIIHDHLAYSVPFGTLAPAELYNMERLHAERADAHHFANMDWDTDLTHQHTDGIPRVAPPMNILQIHPGTASEEGSLEGLRKVYARIAEKRRNDEPLDPFEQNYVGYDAVQLMPIEPPIEHEAGPLFWQNDNPDDEDSDTISVTLHQHDIFDWGYDVMVSASPAVNPAILSSKRPDELVDLIAELHNFPDGPIKVIVDIVYGHTDNQALKLFHGNYLAGANMYGQNLNYRHPVARATWLEMQKRKNDFGVDGVRVDGAQDFKGYDAQTDMLYHDDEFLRQMNDVVQSVAGHPYRPYMIFEDGRPWPRDDWELASTYREVTKQLPNVWQWGPLTFAHNTPFLFTFWVNKSWRVREMTEYGKYWITGCANHDTLRRGTQVDPKQRINTRLGNSLPEVFRNAYDNASARLFDYCMMPGVPMDFINALMRAPWSFIRNTDERYGVKVVSEESRFLHWLMWEERWAEPFVFPRLKEMGFTDLHATRRFFDVLDLVMQATDYNIAATAHLMNNYKPTLPGPELDEATLKAIASAWMQDVFEYCNVSHYTDGVDAQRAAYNLSLREFRRARRWMVENLREDEYFNRQQPANGTAFYFGLRRAPDGTEDILFAANMEGEPVTFIPTALPIPNLPQDGWELTIAAPGIFYEGAGHTMTLHDSQGIVLTRRS